MFKTELTDISSELIRSVLHETIENELESKNFLTKISSASKSGSSNFIGIVYRVVFKKVEESKNDDDESSLILKVSPQNEARRSQFQTRECFLREIFIYDQIFPYFRQFEKMKGVRIEDSFTEYPRCYRTLDVDPEECILFEDLDRRGFSMLDRNKQCITVQHTYLYLQALAKFHALSLAVNDQQPEKFRHFTSGLNDIMINKDNVGLRYFYNQQAEFILKLISDDVDLTAKVKKLFEKEALDIMADAIELESKQSARVISHGDAHQNNLMFRYDHNGEPIEVCMIDWQLSRLASPAMDFAYFVFLCTTKDIRDVHYTNFSRIYHESLSTQLQRLGCDPKKVYPYKMMQEHLRKFARTIMILGTAILPVLTADSNHRLNLDELAVDFTNGKEFEWNSLFTNKSKEGFNKRMRDVIVDMSRFEYI